MLEVYPWHRDAWSRLSELQKRGRLPHALLFSGHQGIGLKQFARAFAMRLLCLDNNQDGQVCGHCQSCQLYLAGNHPDIHFIEPEAKNEQIKITQIRNLIEYVNLKSFSGKNKIIVIEPAERMNRATANALLKTIEEPPEQSMLFLLSYAPEQLLMTIRSRCQHIYFKPAFDSETIQWLAQQNIDTQMSLEQLLRLAGGAPFQALKLTKNDELQCREIVLIDLKAIIKDDYNPVQIAANWQSLGSNNVIIWLLSLLQDLVRLKLLKDKANLTHIDLKEDLRDIIKELDLSQLIKYYHFIILKYQQITGMMNYNPLNILEEIIVNWADLGNN